MNTAARTTAKKETIWTTFGITTMALMTTMLIVSTYIKIPLPFSTASITAQTLVVNLIGMLFAPLQIVAIMASWILLSVLGIGGSLGKLLGPAGGYRYGNAVAAILISLFCQKVKNLKAQTAFLIFVGIPVIYLFGAADSSGKYGGCCLCGALSERVGKVGAGMVPADDISGGEA